MTTRLILVGGFLGAGKTTMLWQAAQRLAKRGKRAGLITNDQAPELVDTAFLSRGGAAVAEVNGSCFCCNFNGFLDASVNLSKQADILIAEPVGSCTDLSATIIQPLKERHGGEFTVAPLSVMADPIRLKGVLDGQNAGLHPSAAYIFRKQLEEADIVVISKADTVSPKDLEVLKARVSASCKATHVCAVSAKTGAGVDAWLDLVNTGIAAGQRIVDVDYDVYAEGEAVLGWLNGTMALRGESPDWTAFVERLLQGLSQEFNQSGAAVGHVKIILEDGEQFLAGNLTGNGDTLNIRGEAPKGSDAKLTINARVQAEPAALDVAVRKVLTETAEGLALHAKPVAWRCLRPGRPNPTHRYAHVVTVARV